MSSEDNTEPQVTDGLFNRTLRRVRDGWWFSDQNRGLLEAPPNPELSDGDAKRLRRQIDACLEAKGGEVSARARAAELGEAYLLMNETGRHRFLQILASDYDVDQSAVDAAIEKRAAADTPLEHRNATAELKQALRAPRVRLLSGFNDLSQGVKFLVDMRAQLRTWVGDDTALASLDDDLKSLLTSWFDLGFLELVRITWDTPAAILEKLIEYEAVHAIQSWDDLKNRLAIDRRCYAFFHPSMPQEPLIFVQVALVDDASDNVQALLDLGAPLGDPDRAQAAVFYSISNCQSGLAGVSFGSFLIKRVATDLASELPGIKQFVTLSPVPGFRKWLERSLDSEFELLDASAIKALAQYFDDSPSQGLLSRALGESDWWNNESLEEVLKPILLRLGARYLLHAARNGKALDRVAHFHLSNGARIERLNWLADTSDNGIAQSAGLMVNYLYQLNNIERNHESYTGSAKRAAAAAVRKLGRVS